MNINIKTTFSFASPFNLSYLNLTASYWAFLLLLGAFLSGCSDPQSMLSGNADANTSNPDVPEIETQSSAKVVEDSAFRIFDGTSFRPKPSELAEAGLEYFELGNSYDLWGKSPGQLRGTTAMPDKQLISELAHHAALGPNELSINIQHWPLTGSDSEVQKNLDRYLKVINWFKEAEPDLNVGFYRGLPIHKVNRSTRPTDSDAYQSWIAMNERLQPLADEVDVFYPTLRTYTNDRDEWVRDAKEQIKLARKLNGDNPVYVILWPKYHTYYDGYEDRLIEPDFWQFQLETARELADGIVISTPTDMKWNASHGWWKKTKQFMNGLGKSGQTESAMASNLPVVSDSEFKVFDGTYYRPRPWALKNYGLSQIRMAYPPTLFGKTTSELMETTILPDKNTLTRVVHDALSKGTRNMAINIEHWSLETDQSTVEANLDRFLKVLNWAKSADSDLNVGFYGALPIRSLGKSTSHTSSGHYQEWKQQNQALQTLADKVDAFYPSLYTLNDDRDEWVSEAKAQIQMARELNPDIPVYVFLWPQYHHSNKELGRKFIEEEFWKLQLQTARKYADGIVLWMPGKSKWNNDAPWWVATRRFMVKMGKVDWASSLPGTN